MKIVEDKIYVLIKSKKLGLVNMVRVRVFYFRVAFDWAKLGQIYALMLVGFGKIMRGVMRKNRYFLGTSGRLFYRQKKEYS